MTTPTPSITGLGAISDPNGTIFEPFQSVQINDGDPVATESVTLTFTDPATGKPIDVGDLGGNGLIKTGVGTYEMQGSAGTLTQELQMAQYHPVVDDATTMGVVIQDTALDGQSSFAATPATGTVSWPAEQSPTITAPTGQTAAAGATINPFAGISITDNGRTDAVTINPPTVLDAAGNFIGGDIFSGPGLSGSNLQNGSYTLGPAGSDGQIASELHQVSYAVPVSAAKIIFHLAIYGGDGVRGNVTPYDSPALSVVPPAPSEPPASGGSSDSSPSPPSPPSPPSTGGGADTPAASGGSSTVPPSNTGIAGAVGTNPGATTPSATTPSGGTAAAPSSGGSGGANFDIVDMTTGQHSTVGGSAFTTATTDSLGITANAPSVFIQSGTGNDIIQATAGGNNVLADTGGQVNFEIGGSGTDTFFLDARNSPVTWNTIAGLHSGDTAIVYGISPQDLAGNALPNAGVTGYQGLTLRTFQNGGAAFLTLAGQSSLSGIASAFGTAPDGSSFLLLHAS